VATDFKALLKDKRVWAGAAVVAAIAVVAAVRNRSGGGGGTAGTATPASPSGYYAPGTGDTTGTDLSGFLSNWGSAQLSAQQSGFQSVLDALKGGGSGQNDDPPPAVVFTKDPAGKPMWALLNSPYGGWMTTSDQGTANSWASQWGGSDNTADTVSWDAWQKLKDKWSK
jgi:hypothetical protein